jgi:hypothetical protein
MNRADLQESYQLPQQNGISPNASGYDIRVLSNCICDSWLSFACPAVTLLLPALRMLGMSRRDLDTLSCTLFISRTVSAQPMQGGPISLKDAAALARGAHKRGRPKVNRWWYQSKRRVPQKYLILHRTPSPPAPAVEIKPEMAMGPLTRNVHPAQPRRCMARMHFAQPSVARTVPGQQHVSLLS